MASNNGKQSKESKAAEAVETPAPESAATPIETVESVKVEIIPPKAVVAVTAASSTNETASGVSAGFDAAFDSSLWSKKSMDIWSENANAFFDFAERLTKAKTFEEITDLQSKFISERLDVILKQSNELLELAQEMVQVTITPIYGAKAA